MIVYRLAHREVVDRRTGLPCGPYATLEYCDAWADRQDKVRRFFAAQEKLCRLTNNYGHPTPWADPRLNGINPSEVCGFDSLTALMKWFHGCLVDLEEIGFEVQRFNVPGKYVRVGEVGQVVFQVEKAERVAVDNA